MSKSFNLLRGHQAEKTVGAYLEKQGYTIIAYNYRTRSGEVDIIATAPSILAFVEVKMRMHEYFDSSEIITPAKQRKIISAAKTFIQHHPYENCTFRFDVALVFSEQNNITYIPNAFTQEW